MLEASTLCDLYETGNVYYSDHNAASNLSSRWFPLGEGEDDRETCRRVVDVVEKRRNEDALRLFYEGETAWEVDDL